MQLNPIFPFHVSKSRMTPTLTGIVDVFCAMAMIFLSERIMKMKREKAILVGIFMILFEYLRSFKMHGHLKSEVVLFIGHCT